jgi:hypothetical protein
MGVSLIYLGINDDNNEMAKMCKVIVEKLENADINCQDTNLGTKALPKPTEVVHEEVWFCGHSRFIEESMGVRPTKDRTLGGFPISEIAKFVKACVMKGDDRKFRLICCESAQHQRQGNPPMGQPPEFKGILGNEYLETINKITDLDKFNPIIHAHISHVEGLICEMAKLWKVDKTATAQKPFTICGLWGAGDVTLDKPISGFMQQGGALQSANTMDTTFRTGKNRNPKGVQTAEVNFAKKKEKAKQNFADGHCSVQQLPDFFGFKVLKGVLTPQVQVKYDYKAAKK